VDIHDRVNYAARRSFVDIDSKEKTITLDIEIDTGVCQVMDYFEIFLSRMKICKVAAKVLDCNFHILINKVKLL